MTTDASSEEHKRSLDSIYAGQTQILDARQQDLDKERQELEEWYRRGLALLGRQLPSEADGDETLFLEESMRGNLTPSRRYASEVNGASGERPWGGRSMAEEVRIILDEIEDEEVFTQPIVRARFIEKYPSSDSTSLQTSISHLLRQLNKAGELERFGKQGPTDPYQYRKTPEYRNRQQRDEARLVGP